MSFQLSAVRFFLTLCLWWLIFLLNVPHVAILALFSHFVYITHYNAQYTLYSLSFHVNPFVFKSTFLLHFCPHIHVALLLLCLTPSLLQYWDNDHKWWVSVEFCAGHLSGPLEWFSPDGSASEWVKGLIARWGVGGLEACWLQAFYNFFERGLWKRGNYWITTIVVSYRIDLYCLNLNKYWK